MPCIKNVTKFVSKLKIFIVQNHFGDPDIDIFNEFHARFVLKYLQERYGSRKANNYVKKEKVCLRLKKSELLSKNR